MSFLDRLLGRVSEGHPAATEPVVPSTEPHTLSGVTLDDDPPIPIPPPDGPEEEVTGSYIDDVHTQDDGGKA